MTLAKKQVELWEGIAAECLQIIKTIGRRCDIDLQSDSAFHRHRKYREARKMVKVWKEKVEKEEHGE